MIDRSLVSNYKNHKEEEVKKIMELAGKIGLKSRKGSEKTKEVISRRLNIGTI